MHLTAALQDVHALPLRLLGVAVEIRGALLELGEVLDGLHRALGAEEALDVHAAQRGRADAMAVLVRSNVSDGVSRCVRMAVGMTIETGDAEGRFQAPPFIRGVELLLRKRCDQQAQPFELLRIENVLEESVEVVRGHQLSARDVAQVRSRRQIDRCREFGEEMLRQVVVEIEARQIACRLLLRFIDQRLRETGAPS
jgi:hypothetical protein